MSLRAGYKGIKNSLAIGMSAFVQKFANALVIKSIGSGLDLSQAGDLSSIIKSIGSGLTLSEAGQLSVDDQILDYSETEQNTGAKWIDGKDIYVKSFHITLDSHHTYNSGDFIQIDDSFTLASRTFLFGYGNITINDGSDSCGFAQFLDFWQTDYQSRGLGLQVYKQVSNVMGYEGVYFYTKTESRTKKGGAK